LPGTNNLLSVRFLADNIADYVFQIGGTTKKWYFINSETAITGLKALLVSQDAGLGITQSEALVGDVAVDASFTVELPINPSYSGAPIKQAVLKLVDGAGNDVPITNSATDTFWLKLRTNHPPRFDANLLSQLAGKAGTPITLELKASDADGDALTFSLIDTAGVGGISLNGSTLTANINDGASSHPVVIGVSDGKETVETTIDFLTFTEANIFSFYADVDGTQIHDEAILFATLQGLLVGSEGGQGQRLFNTNVKPTWSELLGMVVSASVAAGYQSMPEGDLFKAPGIVPAWVDKWYTVARLAGAVDPSLDLNSDPTNEQVVRLLTKILRLDTRVEGIDLAPLLPQFNAPVCSEGVTTDCFVSSQRLYEAQLSRLFGLHMLSATDNPQGYPLRGDLAEVMSRIARLPSAKLNLSASTLEQGDGLNLSLSDLSAPLIKSAGQFIIDPSNQPNPAGHMRLHQLYVDGVAQLQSPIDLLGMGSLPINTDELTSGTHQLLAVLENTDAGTFAYPSVEFEITVTDSDFDGVPDRLDLWSADPRYTTDGNENGIPDELDNIWQLHQTNATDWVYLNGVKQAYTYAQAIVNDYAIDGPDDDYDGANDAVDLYPLIRLTSMIRIMMVYLIPVMH